MHTQPGGAPPVFVDRTGRRRRLSILAGTGLGLGLLASLGLIAAGLFTSSSVPLPGWSDNQHRKPIEAGVDGAGDLGASPTVSSRPSPVTSTAPVRPTPTGATPTTAPSDRTGPQVTGSERPGQGDERRTAKPGRSPGRPG
ncbi:hypothetical protein [Micromonospora sagamiensis]|uniref:Uncharacterized protein n=1 Tax=Micromonospora sagamiensis TaxID=47875 RepID=A0A562WNQ9_9ACTN|nr:hypothetical protein [Micromonospora sagamiensis]TWJ31792.1 hypothetical protein JD81_05353 [Micromonospora sagamiensis]BCL15154.1 hypothetical protein GCM10017556_28930 [Micromonospora sagamiensis]